jgi:hypothetical protein
MNEDFFPLYERFHLANKFWCYYNFKSYLEKFSLLTLKNISFNEKINGSFYCHGN